MAADHKPWARLIPGGPPGRLFFVPSPDAPLLRAARREPTAYTPVWLMRQAGRYLPEYRALRERYGFLELCHNSDAAAEVTLQPVERLGVDAAILFADILLLVEPLGVGLEFSTGDGPVIRRPVRTGADVARLAPIDVAEAVPFVFETVRTVARALGGRVPLIGFAGAPFTVASYLVEGGASRHYLHAKRLMYEEPEAWHRLMALLADATATYLNGQIEAGAQAVQLFDSWVGALGPADYRSYVLPHVRGLIRTLTPGVPVIHFGTGTAALLPLMREAGGDVIGLDWRVDLDAAWATLGHDVAVQGNLDPAVLLAPPAYIRRRAQDVLDRAGGRPGHIFNLGHGIHQETPVDHA
ncbi:MAG: uroporphyrinogen decarboxylase, partial [Candidatus Rokubacteria bacterium]|nr:uroporphyrinogen decarboxylase [Candidatus Rokubacteria bacterium]